MMALSLRAWQTSREPKTKYMPSECLQSSLRKVVHALLTLRRDDETRSKHLPRLYTYTCTTVQLYAQYSSTCIQAG